MNDPEHAKTVFLDGYLATFMEWNVERDLACLPIKCIHPFTAGDPQRPLFVFSCAFDYVAAKAERFFWIVRIADGLSGRWIEFVEPAAGSQPQHARVVLANVPHGKGFTFRISDAVVSSSLGNWIESVQEFLTADPEHARMIFE